MRILLITARADIGGGPLHVDLLARYLPADIKRWIACPDEDPYAWSWRRDPAVRGVFTIPRRRFSLAALFRLASGCRRLRVDIVHSHGKGAGLYSRLLKLLCPWVKVVHTVHGVHIGQYGAVTRGVYLIAERLLNQLTDAFVHVSKGEQAQCLALGLSVVGRSHVVYNGLPPIRPSGNASLPDLDVEARPVILTVARFERQKYMRQALEIATLAQREHPEWLFVWAGDGPERAGLERLAQERRLTNVRFLGYTDQGAELLRQATVVLSTSLWEGLPYALIEACAAGVPIVASQVTGNDEVVTDNQNGLLYPVDAPDQAVRQLGQIISDPGLRARLSQGAQVLFRESFTLKRSVESVSSVYRAVLAGN